MLTNLEVYSSLSSAPDLPLVMGVGEFEDPIHIREILGLGSVKADVSTSPYGSQDGEFYTGSSLGKRNLSITVGFNPDWVVHTVSSLRQKLYSYFMSKQEVTLRLFSDDIPTVEIKGIVESCEPNIFARDPEMQISVICPLPDFVAVSHSEVTGVAAPAPISSDFTLLGNVPTSALLLVTAAAGDPTYDGPVTFEHKTLVPAPKIFRVTGAIGPGVDLRVNSQRGAKAAENLFHPGTEVANLLNSMTADSVWPALMPGTNKIRVLLDAGAAPKPWTLTYFERFGGL